jgi:hypothetical protein
MLMQNQFKNLQKTGSALYADVALLNFTFDYLIGNQNYQN